MSDFKTCVKTLLCLPGVREKRLTAGVVMLSIPNSLVNLCSTIYFELPTHPFHNRAPLLSVCGLIGGGVPRRAACLNLLPWCFSTFLQGDPVSFTHLLSSVGLRGGSARNIRNMCSSLLRLFVVYVLQEMLWLFSHT